MAVGRGKPAPGSTAATPPREMAANTGVRRVRYLFMFSLLPTMASLREAA